MRTIVHKYPGDKKLIDVVAEVMGGTIEGNFIKGDNDVYKGTHFLLTLEEGILGMMVDTFYKETTLVHYDEHESQTVGLYFYITDSDVVFRLNKRNNQVGAMDYNFAIVDSSLTTDYVVQKKSNMYVICIFVYKNLLEKYMSEIPYLAEAAKEMFDTEKNTIIRVDRMTPVSMNLIRDFQKIPYDHPHYEFYFKGLLYALISEYLNSLKIGKIIIGKAIGEDVKSILQSKLSMLEAIEYAFPGIDILAEHASMSPSKYKKLFTKISGYSPGAYFLNNKLQKAKELLETKQYTIGEVVVKLHYSSISYFSKRFKEAFGVFPKEYQSLL